MRIEGPAIWAAAAWETVALGVNFVAGRKVLHPITDLLRWSARHRYGRFGWWLLLGWLVNHVYENEVSA